MPVYWCCCDQRDFIFNAQFSILPRNATTGIELVINMFEIAGIAGGEKDYGPCVDQLFARRPYSTGDAGTQMLTVPGAPTSQACDASDVTFELTWEDSLNGEVGAHADSSDSNAALFHGVVDQTGGVKNMLATLRMDGQIDCEGWEQLNDWMPMKLSPWFARTDDVFPQDPGPLSWAMGWSGPLVIEPFCLDTVKPDPDDDDEAIPRVLLGQLNGVRIGESPSVMTPSRVVQINGTMVRLFRTHQEVDSPCTIHSLGGWGGGALTGGTNSDDHPDMLQLGCRLDWVPGDPIQPLQASIVATIGSERLLNGIRVGAGSDMTPGESTGRWIANQVQPFTCRSAVEFWNDHTRQAFLNDELDWSDATVTISAV